MDKNRRTFLNVLAQYVRTVINICLSLYSTRLALQALGKSDYGLFMLVGGVVAMLAFLTNAMVVTTQRHLSFYYGKKDLQQVKTVFSNALITHICLGLLLVVILVALRPFLIAEDDGYLNINQERIDTAKTVYLIVVATLFMTFVTAPFRALFIARENIVFISIVDICDGIIKVALVICLFFVHTDKLLFYSLIFLFVQFLNLSIFSLFANHKYAECSLLPRIKDVKWKEIGRIFNFAGWTIYGNGCVIARTQGVQVLLNRFFGTVINSAYGIATQVYGSTAFLSQAILNAMSPRVIKAEGAGDRNQMLRLAGVTSKFSYLLLSMFTIPLCFEMNGVLNFWLGEPNVPEYAVIFCQCMIISTMCDQITAGLIVANRAIGRIRNYQLLINTTKVMTVPLVWLSLHLGYPVAWTMYIYIFIEFLCAVLRLFYMKATTSLSLMNYSKQVFGKILLPTVTLVVVCLLCMMLPNMKFRFLITLTLAVGIDVLVVYYCALEKSERDVVLNFIRKKRNDKKGI